MPNLNVFGLLGALMALYFLTIPRFQVQTEGIVLISGASTGIGRHAADQLAAVGYTVYAGVRKQSDFEAIEAANNPKLHPIKLDVTDHASVSAAAAKLKTAMERKNLPFVAVVNNAGISRRTIAEFHDIDDARAVFETNFFGMMDLTQATLPLLRQTPGGGGRIVMISSLAGLVGNPLSSVYSGSKFAMEGFSDTLRREVAHFNISVSIVEPAFVTSQIFVKSKVNAEEATSVKADTVPEHVVALYPDYHGPRMEAKRHKQINLADPPTVTSEAILDAIRNPQPKTRYVVANVVGYPAWILALLLKYAPDRMVDALLKFF